MVYLSTLRFTQSLISKSFNLHISHTHLKYRTDKTNIIRHGVLLVQISVVIVSNLSNGRLTSKQSISKCIWRKKLKQTNTFPISKINYLLLKSKQKYVKNKWKHKRVSLLYSSVTTPNTYEKRDYIYNSKWRTNHMLIFPRHHFICHSSDGFTCLSNICQHIKENMKVCQGIN